MRIRLAEHGLDLGARGVRGNAQALRRALNRFARAYQRGELCFGRGQAERGGQQPRLRPPLLSQIDKHQPARRGTGCGFDRQDSDQDRRPRPASDHDRVGGQRRRVAGRAKGIGKTLQFAPPASVGHIESPIVDADLAVEQLIGRSVDVDDGSKPVRDRGGLLHQIEPVYSARKDRPADDLRKGGSLGQTARNLREDALVLLVKRFLADRSPKGEAPERSLDSEADDGPPLNPYRIQNSLRSPNRSISVGEEKMSSSITTGWPLNWSGTPGAARTSCMCQPSLK